MVSLNPFPLSRKAKFVIGFVGVAVAVVGWIWMFVSVLETEFARGAWLVGTIVILAGIGNGAVIYYVVHQPRGKLILMVSETLDKIGLAHANEPAIKQATFDGGRPKVKSLVGAVEGESEIMVVDDWNLQEADDLYLSSTWEKVASPDEYLASKAKIKENHEELTEDAQESIVQRALFSTVVRRAVERINNEIYSKLEKGEHPDGEAIQDEINHVLRQHGLLEDTGEDRVNVEEIREDVVDEVLNGGGARE